MYQVTNNLSSTILSNIFTENNNVYDLRNKREFKTENVRTVLNGTETTNMGNSIKTASAGYTVFLLGILGLFKS